jgi:CheY-like chemotaxis protein
VATEAARPLRILIADDEPVSLGYLQACLESLGHDVVAVQNGPDAVAVADDEGFDAAVIDVQLPDMDGMAVTRVIRQAEDAAQRPRLPIVALSGDGSEAAVQASLAAGMDGYLTKPVSPEALQRLFDRLGVTGDKQAIRRDHPGAGLLAGLPSHDADLALVMLGDFLQDVPQVMSRLQDAAERQDDVAVKRHAHRLAGALSHFHDQDLARLAQAIDQQPADPALTVSVARLAEGVAALAEEVRAVLAADHSRKT